MNTYKLSNVPLENFRHFLQDMGCTKVSTEGGHEKWKKDGCLRSVILQTHVTPVPEFIIKNNLRTLGLTRKSFIEWMKQEDGKNK